MLMVNNLIKFTLNEKLPSSALTFKLEPLHHHTIAEKLSSEGGEALFSIRKNIKTKSKLSRVALKIAKNKI
jgi:hypothetical protein